MHAHRADRRRGDGPGGVLLPTNLNAQRKSGQGKVL
jgi:hypothetical protein